MSKALKLTYAAVAKITPPTDRASVNLTDVSGNGLVLYVGKSGTKVWKHRFRYAGGNPDLITIGEWPLVTYEEAKERCAYFERVNKIEGRNPKTAVFIPKAAPTVGDVLDLHLGTVTPETAANLKSLYRDVRAVHGRTLVRDFSKPALAAWIDANYANRPGAARSLVRNLCAAFNKASDEIGGLSDMPGDFKNPASKLASKLVILADHTPGSYAVAWEPGEWDLIEAAIAHGYAEEGTCDTGPMVIDLCRHTGARPSEIMTAKWSEIEERTFGGTLTRCLVKPKHKTARKTHRDRVIWLSDEAETVLTRAKAHRLKTGYRGDYIFPAVDKRAEHFSQPWQLCQRLGKAVGFEFTTYNLRSAYINFALDSLGFDALPLVSQNVGHTDVNTTLGFYHKNRESKLADAAQRVGEAFAARRSSRAT